MLLGYSYPFFNIGAEFGIKNPTLNFQGNAQKRDKNNDPRV